MSHELESRVFKNIISELCGIPASQIEDSVNLFELGFDSMLALRMVLRVEEEFGVEISSRDLYEHPSVDGLSEIITLRRAEIK